MSKTKLAGVSALILTLALAGCGSKPTVEEGQAMFEAAFAYAPQIKSQEFAAKMMMDFSIEETRTISTTAVDLEGTENDAENPVVDPEVEDTTETQTASGKIDFDFAGYTNIADAENFTFDMEGRADFDVAPGLNLEGAEDSYAGYIAGGLVVVDDTVYFNADVDRDFLNEVAGSFAPLAEGYLNSGDEKRWWSVPMPPEIQAEFKTSLEAQQELIIPSAELVTVKEYSGSKKVFGLKSECFDVEINKDQFIPFLEQAMEANPTTQQLTPEEQAQMEEALKYIDVINAEACVSGGENPQITYMEAEIDIDIVAAINSGNEANGLEPGDVDGYFKIKYEIQSRETEKDVVAPEGAQPLDFGAPFGGPALDENPEDLFAPELEQIEGIEGIQLESAEFDEEAFNELYGQ